LLMEQAGVAGDLQTLECLLPQLEVSLNALCQHLKDEDWR
jgi:hypothetical protein